VKNLKEGNWKPAALKGIRFIIGATEEAVAYLAINRVYGATNITTPKNLMKRVLISPTLISQYSTNQMGSKRNHSFQGYFIDKGWIQSQLGKPAWHSFRLQDV